MLYRYFLFRIIYAEKFSSDIRSLWVCADTFPTLPGYFSNQMIFLLYLSTVASVTNSFEPDCPYIYESLSKNFWTGLLERELQMVQPSATRCSCIAVLWVSLVSFAAITLCIVSQRVFIVVVYFVIDSVRKLLDTPSYSDLFWNSHRFWNLAVCYLKNTITCFRPRT
jgi:hypothetical protein